MPGDLVSSENRADTMALYLQDVQWRVRRVRLVDGPSLGAALPVREDPFTEEEVRLVVRRLRSERAAGPDQIPAEYWKAIAEDVEALRWMVEFMNLCRSTCEIPSEWHLAQVSALHKKGRIDLCENYRPISLLSVGYKIFSALILGRLKDGGAEDRLSKTQYGFRKGYGTEDAIFIANRIGMGTARWTFTDLGLGLGQGL